MTNSKLETNEFSGIKSKIIIVALIGLILILVGVAVDLDLSIKSVISSIGQALLAGGIIGYIIELPEMIDNIAKVFDKVITTKSYLRNQSMESLKSIRLEAAQEIYLKNSKDYDTSLLEFSEEINELLTEPYFNYYREKVSLSIDTSKQCFVKESTTSFEMINPMGDKQQFSKVLSLGSYFKKINGVAENEHREIKTLRIKRDGELDYTDHISKLEANVEEVIPPIYDLYNLKIKYSLKAGESEKVFEYQKSIIVETTEVVYLPLDDLTYSHRIGRPIKSYHLNYVIDPAEDYELVGDCFAVKATPTNKDIIVYIDNNSLSIECRKWLLPGNGVFVVLLPRKKEILDIKETLT